MFNFIVVYVCVVLAKTEVAATLLMFKAFVYTKGLAVHG